MMKHLLIALALLFFGGAAADHAHAQAADNVLNERNLPFIDGAESPMELASWIEAANKRDSTGTTPILPAQCPKAARAPKRCASAMNYLNAFREIDKKAVELGKLNTIADLPAYLRSLEQVVVPSDGRWQMYCIRRVAENRFQEVSACVERSFHKGEVAWMSPYSREIVLAHDCKNPVNGPVVEEVIVQVMCREIHFNTPPGTVAVRYEVVGEKRLEGNRACPVLVQPAGKGKLAPSDDCPAVNCTFLEAEAVAVQATGVQIPVRSVRGSYNTDGEGHHVFYYPPSIEDRQIVIICIDVRQPDGTILHYKGKAVAGPVYDAQGKVTLPPFVP